MKKKILIVTSLFCILLMPMSTNAQTFESDSFRAVPDGVCHCGAPREQTLIGKHQEEVCPEHGPTCDGYYSSWAAWYHYCTNPNCKDNYQEPWILTELYHL